MSAAKAQVIPVNEPLISEAARANVVDALSTGWISSAGKYLDAFEREWAAYCGMPHGVAVANGTVALEIAVSALDIGPGDEVILPTFTIISCAQAVTKVGATPVLVDAEPTTWGMDVGQVAGRITSRTRAIMPVHIYGHPVDMDPLVALASRHDLAIIEDAAEVHGAEYLTGRHTAATAEWRRCGSFGHLSTFSFYANKIVTTGEGGMVLAKSESHAKRLRSLRNLCFRPDRRFLHTEIGGNYRLTNLQAALGVAQIAEMPRLLQRKVSMGRRYTELLSGIDGLQLPIEEPWAKHVYWMYGIVLDESRGIDAVEFAQRLHGLGVETRPFFLGMHEQPVFRDAGLFRDERYPVAERLARQGLYLPSGMAITDDQIERAAQAVRQVLAQ